VKKTKLIFFLLGVAVFSNKVFANDEVNDKKEESLNRIYKTYNAEPTDNVIWELVTEQSGQQSYKTQKGDTLWDISEMLFGDGFFWPKVWSLNPDITNPHDVNPGAVLNFFPGTMTEAPTLSFERSQSEVLPEVLAMTLNVELPPPQKESTPPLDQYPSSIPGWKFRAPQEKEKILMDLSRPSKTNTAPEQYLSYFADQGDKEAEGEVIQAELGMSSASEHQFVFVRTNGGKSVGQTLLALKEVSNVEDQFSSKKAKLIQVQGVLQLVEVIDSEAGTYRALVTKTIAPIEVGAKLFSDSMPTLNVSDSGGEAPHISARVFGGQYGVHRRFFGPDGILFLNQGSGAGLTAGQVLNIYKNQGVRSYFNLVKDNPRIIGKIKIVRTSEEFATAVVLSANEEIYIGDGTSVESVVER